MSVRPLDGDLAKLSLEESAPVHVQYDYSVLPSPSTHFRILTILPGAAETDIRCCLDQTQIDSTAEYEALSYTWGEPGQTRSIWIEEKTLSVTRNCHSALGHLRSPTDHIAIWVDAICINQSNALEKTAQIAQMKDIYSHATKVIVWLGAEDHETQVAFGLLRRLGDLPSYKIGDPAVSPEKLPDLRPLGRLLHRDWFERIWCVQEVTFARFIDLHCGSLSISWSVYVKALEWYWKYVHDVHEGLVGPESRLTNAVQLRNIWARRTFSRQDMKLELLVSQFRHWKSTDPRDKIYALMNLVTDQQDKKEKIDYTVDVKELYTRLVEHFIIRDNRLDVLGQCDPPVELPGLPSWVPDWSMSKVSRAQLSEQYRPRSTNEVKFWRDEDGRMLFAIPTSFAMMEGSYGTWQSDPMIPEEMNFSATLNRPAEAYFPKDKESLMFLGSGSPFSEKPNPERMMQLKGLRIDVVEELTTPLFRPDVDCVDPKFMAEWEAFALTPVSEGKASPYGDDSIETRVETYWRTLVTSRIYLERSPLHVRSRDIYLFNQWRASLGFEPLIPPSSDKPPEQSAEPKSLPPSGYRCGCPPSMDLNAEEHTVVNYLGSIRTWTLQRRLGRMKSGRLGLLPYPTEVGDIVVLLFGGSVPFVIRQRQGMFVYKGWFEREGEKYAVMSAIWHLIGEAYVHGVMDGEGMQGFDDIEKVQEEFWFE